MSESTSPAGAPDEGRGRAAAAGRHPWSIIAWCGLALALTGAGATVLAGVGHRFDWWGLSTGFGMLGAGACAGAVGAGVSLAGSVVSRPGAPRRGLVPALAGALLGVAVLVYPWSYVHRARSLPAIHDISTDTVNPPAFVAVLPLRRGAPNPAAYGGAQIAALQKKAYPDIVPAHLAVPPAQAFRRALDAAQGMGWEVVAAAPAQGRIEATDTTFWFGFKDDVVIRISANGAGSRVDVRSLSRVGRSDVGKNAERIRAFLRRLGE